jgi:hypothetical protein
LGLDPNRPPFSPRLTISANDKREKKNFSIEKLQQDAVVSKQLNLCTVVAILFLSALF